MLSCMFRLLRSIYNVYFQMSFFYLFIFLCFSFFPLIILICLVCKAQMWANGSINQIKIKYVVFARNIIDWTNGLSERVTELVLVEFYL